MCNLHTENVFIRTLKVKLFFAVYIGSIFSGFSFGWLSPVINVLSSTNTPLSSGPITVVERAWIGGLLHATAVIGSLIYGVLVPYTGVKKALNFTILPGVVSSLIFFYVLCMCFFRKHL